MSLHRCLALTLYHGCSVFVHLLSAFLLNRRREAHFQHERIKCLTLLVAFVIMMVGLISLFLGLLLNFTLTYPVCGAFQEVCPVLLSSRLYYSSAYVCERADPPPVFVKNTGLQTTAHGADPYLTGLRDMQVGFVLMFVKEQTDLRGAPSVPVPVTAVYFTMLVRSPVVHHAYHACGHSAWHRHWQTYPPCPLKELCCHTKSRGLRDRL